MMSRLLAGIALSVFGLACGGGTSNGPANNCSDFSGPYSLTTEIVSTTCPVGLHVITQAITWTFVQTAPSCNFTMTNSLYPDSQYSGYFSTQGSGAKVTWTSVAPAPSVGGYALTYTSEDLTVSPAVAPGTPTISGSVAWSSAYPCTGTTNVCNGSAASDCLIPN
jgi:hypothetical protein